MFPALSEVVAATSAVMLAIAEQTGLYEPRERGS